MFAADENGREIKISKLIDVQVIGESSYPGIRLFSHYDGTVHNPIDERIMSLPDAMNDGSQTLAEIKHTVPFPVFFFVYNTDNYYHFLYDTLPYLISYRNLKKCIPELKLLVRDVSNDFVREFFDLLGIKTSDITFVHESAVYDEVYVSSSYTHGGKSNLPPRQEVYDLFNELSANTLDTFKESYFVHRKLYVSRRAYKHGDYTNIGTNYTAKRKLVNEDELVEFLAQRRYLEVFTELLPTRKKIAMFENCTHVVGPIGGGLCNVLFSRPSTKLTAIVSPHFLSINGRFCYSLSRVNTTYFKHTKHVESTLYKKYMRVKVHSLGIVGEIDKVMEDHLWVLYSKESVAGWNAQKEYDRVRVQKCDVEIIDPGLNSAWEIDMDRFKAEFVDV